MLEWKNGDVYEGNMKKGKMDGFGKFTFNDGKIYEGEDKNGIKQGKGKLIYPGNKIYDGYFILSFLELSSDNWFSKYNNFWYCYTYMFNKRKRRNI